MIWVIKEIKCPKVTDTEAAYMAGCLDCDGSMQLKKYHGQLGGRSLQPRIHLGQSTEVLPRWLHSIFGGCLHVTKKKPPSRNMLYWAVGDSMAIAVCTICLPYLRIKKRRAEILIEVWNLNHNMQYKSYAYWYGLEHPNWREEKLLTTEEVHVLLKYRRRGTVAGAIRSGVLLALPNPNGRRPKRIPSGLVEWLMELRADAHKRGKSKICGRPPQLGELQLWLSKEMRMLNLRGQQALHQIGDTI